MTWKIRFFRRACWLAALPLWACACVVPVAPQFEDPAGNYSPFVASSTPPAGAVLPVSGGTPAPGAVLPASGSTIEVTLGDPNLEDVLAVLWLIDYPPYDSDSRIGLPGFSLPSSGAVNRQPIRFAPSCSENQIASGIASHRVTLSVADRPFLPPEEAPPGLPLDSVSDVGFVVRTTWTVDLDCP